MIMSSATDIISALKKDNDLRAQVVQWTHNLDGMKYVIEWFDSFWRYNCGLVQVDEIHLPEGHGWTVVAEERDRLVLKYYNFNDVIRYLEVIAITCCEGGSVETLRKLSLVKYN